MHKPLITILLIALTLLGLLGSLLGVLRLRDPGERPDLLRGQRWLLALIALGAAGVFGFDMLFVHATWAPLASHLDGLLLMVVLLAPLTLYLQSHERLAGLITFTMPLLTIMLAWAICASSFTFEPFAVGSLWRVVHLTSVYLGTLCVTLAATAGAMYLAAQRRLRLKKSPLMGGRLASLEGTERLLVLAALLGFAMISLALVTGFVIQHSEPTHLGAGWWHSPKILLALTVWVIYAALFNARRTSGLRGSRAAWLSILGFVLLLTTLGLVNAMAARMTNPPPPAPIAPDAHVSQENP